VKGWRGQLSEEQQKWVNKYSDKVPIDVIRVKEVEEGLETESSIEGCEVYNRA
jgi:hypothetical protein